MEAIRLQKIIENDGEVFVSDLPFKRGEEVEIIFLADSKGKKKKRGLTGKELLNSGIVGMWKGRGDIEDSQEYARKLRGNQFEPQRSKEHKGISG